MDEKLEKELEEALKEILLPENRQKLLLAVFLGMNLASANTVHVGNKLEAICNRSRLISLGNPLFDDYVKNMIERNESELKKVQVVKSNYSLANKESPY